MNPLMAPLGMALGAQPQARPASPLLSIPGINGAAPAVGGPAQPQQPMYSAKQDSGIRSFLGKLGDALLVGSGQAPMYQPGVEKRELGAQLANYLGADNPELAKIMMENPTAGMQLYNAMREDGRFDRTAAQDDRRIGQTDRTIGERERANRAGEAITMRGQDVSQRGQDVSSETQLRLQQLRSVDAQLNRQHQAALRAGDREAASALLAQRQVGQREIASLSGGSAGTVTEVVEYPGQEARTEGGFLGFGGTDVPATPGRKVTTKRPIQQQSQARSLTGSEVQQYAQREGVSVEQARAALAQAGYAIR